MIWKRRLEQMWTMVSDDSKMNTEPSAEWKHKNNSLTEQIRLIKITQIFKWNTSNIIDQKVENCSKYRTLRTKFSGFCCL